MLLKTVIAADFKSSDTKNRKRRLNEEQPASGQSTTIVD